mgnify:CR=1 FL=1
MNVWMKSGNGAAPTTQSRTRPSPRRTDWLVQDGGGDVPAGEGQAQVGEGDLDEPDLGHAFGPETNPHGDLADAAHLVDPDGAALEILPASDGGPDDHGHARLGRIGVATRSHGQDGDGHLALAGGSQQGQTAHVRHVHCPVAHLGESYRAPDEHLLLQPQPVPLGEAPLLHHQEGQVVHYLEQAKADGGERLLFWL